MLCLTLTRPVRATSRPYGLDTPADLDFAAVPKGLMPFG